MSIAQLVSDLPKQGYVFVSYAREDMARVRELVRALEAGGIRCKFDEKVVSGGGPFPAELAEAIRGSSGVVVMLSPVSVNRPWVHREVGFAQDQNLPVFPVELAPVEIPDTLALRVQDLHRIRLHEAAPSVAARQRPGTKLVGAAALVLGLGVGGFVWIGDRAVWPAWSTGAATTEALPATGSSDDTHRTTEEGAAVADSVQSSAGSPRPEETTPAQGESGRRARSHPPDLDVEASGAGTVGVDGQVSGRVRRAEIHARGNRTASATAPKGGGPTGVKGDVELEATESVNVTATGPGSTGIKGNLVIGGRR